MDHLRIRSIHQAYQGHFIVKDLSLSVAHGEIACLLGASGCGKTTALRCIAGFEPILSGSIHVGDIEVSGSRHLPPEQRAVGMVFQDYALFPHLSVADNIAFGIKSMPATAKRARVDELLVQVGLDGQGGKHPHQLSGGQQQRVALARALAPSPQLLLLDEPFSNLDVELRERLSLEVRAILKQAGITAVMVTHDQNEAFAIADVVGVMREGRIEQWDTPYNIYHRPATRYVAGFIGQGVFVRGDVLNAKEVRIELGTLRGNIPSECLRGCDACEQDCHVCVLLRPDDIVHDDASAVQAEVVTKNFRGAEFLYTLRLPSGIRVLSWVPSHHNHAIGESIGIRLDADHVVIFRDTGEAHAGENRP